MFDFLIFNGFINIQTPSNIQSINNNVIAIIRKKIDNNLKQKSNKNLKKVSLFVEDEENENNNVNINNNNFLIINNDALLKNVDENDIEFDDEIEESQEFIEKDILAKSRKDPKNPYSLIKNELTGEVILRRRVVNKKGKPEFLDTIVVPKSYKDFKYKKKK